MARPCDACRSEHVEDIDAALRAGERPGAIAARFEGVSEGACRRHGAAHVQDDSGAIVLMANEIELAERLQPDRLAQEYGRIYGTAEAISTHALGSGAAMTALKALQSQVGILDSVRKLKESDDVARAAVSSADSANELRLLVTGLKAILPMYPEVGIALAVQLEEAGEWAVGAEIRNLVK